MLAPKAAANAIAWGVSAASAFVVTAVVYRSVGADLFGVWAVIVAIKGFALLLEAGLSFAAARQAARTNVDPDARAQVRAAHSAGALAGLAVSIIGLSLAWLPAAALGLAGQTAAAATLVMALATLEAGISVGASGVFGGIRGRERFDIWAGTSTVAAVTGAALVVILVPSTGIVGAGVALVIARLASLAFAIAIAWRWDEMPGISVDPRAIRAAARFAAPLWLVALGTQVGMGSDVLIVGFYFGAIPAGAYSLGAVVPAMAAALLYALLDVAYPRLAARVGAVDQTQVVLLLRASALLAALGFGAIASQADVVLRVWTGEAPELSVAVARIYSLAWALNAPAHVLVLLLISRGKHAFLGPFVLLEAATSLTLSLILGSLGYPAGPAVATLIVLLVSNVVVLPILATRRLGLELQPLAMNVAAAFALGVVVAIFIGAMVHGVAGDVMTLVAVTALTLLSAALLLDLTIRRPERYWVMVRHHGWRVYMRQWWEARRARVVVERARAERPNEWVRSPDPLVTVRIATYNRGRLVAERAIASAQAQTYSNIEILVVGDHCDEATADAVRSVRDPRVRFVNLPTRGAYPSRPERRWMVAGAAPMNHALEIAAGDWLAPLDDDDEFTTDHVEVLLDACRSRGLDFAYGMAQMETRPGVWDPVGSWPLRHGQIIHASVLYSMDLRGLRHDVDSWRLHEPGDWNLWHRMRSAGARMGFVDQVVTWHYLERREIRT